MKAFLLTLISFIGLASCASIDRKFKNGDYESVIEYGIKKYRSGKKLKTQEVQAIETAYRVINDQNMDEIISLASIEKNDATLRIIGLYEKLHRRNKVMSYAIPIISKEGYEGSFAIADYNDKVEEYKEMYCNDIYRQAAEMVADADTKKNKDLAKKAYNHISNIDKYNANYPGAKELKDRAVAIGHTKVGVEIVSDVNGHAGRYTEEIVSDMSISSNDNLWYDYFWMDHGNKDRADVIMSVRLEDIDLGREAERAHSFTESTKICISKEKVKEMRDTVEVWVEREVFENVSATITEVYRERDSRLKGSIRIIDNVRREVIRDIPVNLYHSFDGFGMSFYGDRRALSSNVECRLDGYLESFPDDREVVRDLASQFTRVVMDESRSAIK
jgi:hypothetical protein